MSGTFFVPRGDPPVGGWPVISMAHSTTGLTMDCGLSIHPDLLGFDKAVKFFLDKGMAVAMTDYEGLGAPGVHPFLEPSTAAFNVIDAVRALRALFPAVSPRWVALGSSQGGQAAWAASELDELYGEGVDLIGSVALAPGANLSGLADLAFEEKLTRAQLDVMPHVTVGAQRSFPSAPLENLLHGDALERTDLLISCDAMAQPARQQLLTPDDVKPATRADADALSDSLRRMALPRSRVTAPLLVVSGLDDQVVPPSSIRSAVERACRMGGQIEFIEIKGAGHAAVGPDERVMTWIGNRFARIPAPSDCAVLKGTT